MVYDLQRANVWKRISAFLLDIILLSIVAVGSAFLLSLATGYDKKYDRYEKIVGAVTEKYGVDFGISETQYNALSEEEKAQYDAAFAELNGNAEALKIYNLVINLSLVIVTASILIAYLVLEFALPLIFKNGQTLGKKVFGVALMRQNGVKVNGPVMFIRTVLCKFAVETMIAAYIVIMFIWQRADLILLILLVLIPLVNLILFFATKNHTPIHDLLSGTVAVDFASQMIFDSEEEMIAYKTKVHSEMVENQMKEYPVQAKNQHDFK